MLKIKFIIARAGANAYWQYYNKNYLDKRLPEYKNDPPIVNEVVDAFLNGDAQEATKFDTYEQAQAEIEKFSKIVHEKNESKTSEFAITSENTNEYPGVGIYRIDKVFVIELP